MSVKAGDERRRQILDHARGTGHIGVTELADRLAVASETVRRDLKVLEDHGLIRRTHGGAYPVESAGFESSMDRRAGSLVAEKHRIAEAAVAALGDAETVFVDEGYTPQLIAERLAVVERPLTVVTSSLAAAGSLAANSRHTTILLGGRVRGRTMGIVDHWATSMLTGLVIDLAVLGANGLSREHGLTTPDPAVAAVKQTAARVSRRRMFVGVHTKFGVASFCRFAEIADFELLVTDSGLPAYEAHRYSVMGPQVVRV
ncbi:DeoR/GlpR family DNA-binding transcription regulator [Nakamurella lactea]|uniref:DeoR/GlpR family DNA-binding transcription regulator n=1 Tax=Nakamurella lactea TaxID=459515 RepID=UPI000404F2C6|nr:DeoR/GlpR family DNA-binding transcription regulator [Nakamurella lactea]